MAVTDREQLRDPARTTASRVSLELQDGREKFSSSRTPLRGNSTSPKEFAPGSGAVEALAPQYQGLLDTTAQLAGVSSMEAVALAKDLDACFVEQGERARRSTLNNDGSPVQTCVTVGARGRHVRLLVDPASTETCPTRRFGRAQAALRNLVISSPEPDLGQLIPRILAGCLPASEELALHLSSCGAIWVGSDIRRRGFAAYVSARWGPRESRWRRTLRWLSEVAGSRVHRLLQPLASLADVASVGVDGYRRSNLRAKIYFRLTAAHPLEQLPPPLFAEQPARRFLKLALSNHSIRRTGLVLSVSVGLPSGELLGCKIDICAHCTPRIPAGWVTLLDDLVSEFELGDLGVRDALVERRVEPAFVGFGIGANGSHHLNLYVKAPRRQRSGSLGVTGNVRCPEREV